MNMQNLKNLSLSAFLTPATTTAANAAEAVPTNDRICTRDYNAWGQASQCSCPEGSTYVSRSAFCFQGELEKTQAEGYISTDVAAIGRETTGVVLEASSQDQYELILPLRLKTKLENSPSDIIYKIEGDTFELPGTESRRPAIIVTSLTPTE